MKQDIMLQKVKLESYVQSLSKKHYENQKERDAAK